MKTRITLLLLTSLFVFTACPSANDKDKNPLSMDIAIITDYKYTAKGSTNREGRLSLEIEGTFPGDSVKQIFIRESANATKYETVKGDYDLDKKKVHQIILS